MAQSAESQAESFYLTSSLHFLSHLNPPKRCQAWHSGQGQPLCPLSAVQRAWSKLKKSMSDLPAGDHLPHVMPREQAGKGRGHRAPGVPGLQDCSHHVPAGALGVDEPSPCQGSPVISLTSGRFLGGGQHEHQSQLEFSYPKSRMQGFREEEAQRLPGNHDACPAYPEAEDPAGVLPCFPPHFPPSQGMEQDRESREKGGGLREEEPHTPGMLRGLTAHQNQNSTFSGYHRGAEEI